MQFRKYTLGTFMCFMMGVLAPQAQNTTPKDTIKTILPANKHEALNKLNDNPKAKKYDEKWLKELSNSAKILLLNLLTWIMANYLLKCLKNALRNSIKKASST